jgi:DUF1680 family protein
MTSKKTCETIPSSCLIYLNCVMMHGPANLKSSNNLTGTSDVVKINDKFALHIVISLGSGEGQMSECCDHGSKSSPFVKSKGNIFTS